MTDIDAKIRNTLKNSNAEPDLDFEREITVREIISFTFRKRGRWLFLMGAVYTIFFGVAAVFAAIKFFQTNDPRDQLAYATVFTCGILLGAFMKMWYWSLLNRNVLAREIKRLELQIARLAEGK